MNLVILSRNRHLYSTSRLLDTAKKNGHEVQVIDPLKCNIIMEKRKPQVHYLGRDLKDVDAIIPRIGASITFYGSAVIRQFEMMGVFTTVDSNALLRSRDKLRSLQVLSRGGLGLPKTVFTNYSREVDEVIDAVGGAPLIIKLLEGTQGLGVVLAESKKAASSVIEAFHDLKARVIVQEFIKEAGGADLRAFVVDGEIVGAMKRQGKAGEFRSNLHRGGSSNVIKLTRKEKNSAIMAADSLGLRVAGVDMLQSKRGPLILEVNSSPGLEGIESATQVDIASKIIDYVERQVTKPRKKQRRSKG